MRAIEGREIESGAVSGAQLMERAGQAAAATALAHFPGLVQARRKGAEVLVLCGPGNNGGDGFVVARALAEAGFRPRLLFAGEPGRLPQDALEMHDKWAALWSVEPLSALPSVLSGPRPALLVDALFGTGLSRDLTGPVVDALTRLVAQIEGPWAGVPVLALDIPSGLCADSGVARGPVLPAGLTVAFHCAKPGHFLDQGPDFCGHVAVVDIGLAPLQGAAVTLIKAPDTARLMKAGGHKYSHGHALIAGGGVGQGGAARLAARAALRVGAGLVTLMVPPAALQENAARLDAVMLRRGGDGAALGALIEDPRFNALCLGPGLGIERAAELVPVALAARRATLLDADALSAFASDPDALFAALHPGCLLTPHDGEFRRLFPDLAERSTTRDGPIPSRLDIARAAAERAGCVVLLKGRDTVIATPDGRAGIHCAAYDRAAPWLATAGSGDVLAGLISGLMARGFPPYDAACTGAWLHVEAARQFGPGLIAEDIPEQIPAVLRSLA